MGKSYKETFANLMTNPEYKKEWDNSEAEREIMRAMIDARVSNNMTQEDLSQKTGISQADICRLERGAANPSLKTLKRIAHGVGMKLKIEFVPDTHEVKAG